MKEKRSHPRYRLCWPVTLILGNADSGPLVEGRIYDISMSGASVLSDRHIRDVRQLTLQMLPPPLYRGQPQKVITVRSTLVYSVHSDEHMRFRAGLRFVHLEESERRQLAERLEHHVPVFEKA